MNFSINTDDPGPFGCSMLSEYALVAQTFGLTGTDFDRVYVNTIRSGFGLSDLGGEFQRA
jgi:adenosine deaminase